jgi:hypothetical protein
VMTEVGLVATTNVAHLEEMKGENNVITGKMNHVLENLRQRTRWRQPVSFLPHLSNDSQQFLLEHSNPPPNAPPAGLSVPPADAEVDGEIEDGEDVEEDEAAMMAAMGFGGFDTTKVRCFSRLLFLV